MKFVSLIVCFVLGFLASVLFLVREDTKAILEKAASPLGLVSKAEEDNPWIKKYNPEACTDPYYTVEIRGVTYSGSTKTAHEAYLESAKDFKRILYDPDLEEKDRWQRLKNIQEMMDGYNAFRGECEWYAKGFVSLEDFEKHTKENQ